MIVPRGGEGGSRLALEAVSAVNSDLLKGVAPVYTVAEKSLILCGSERRVLTLLATNSG
jgi:hypothetical protein